MSEISPQGLAMGDEPFGRLSERQRRYLRLVAENRTSLEIAYIDSVSGRAVDKQLMLATKTIGVTSRFEAARRFVAYEARVETFDPPGAAFRPSRNPFLRLPLPVPSKARPINMLTPQQVLIWAVIIAIATPIGITVAAMVVMAITFLLGGHTV
jgi:DNA-binding CsgD family transcriptional regulator